MPSVCELNDFFGSEPCNPKTSKEVTHSITAKELSNPILIDLKLGPKSTYVAAFFPRV